MADLERLAEAAEVGRQKAAETLAMMDRQRDEAARLGIDLPAFLAADYAARPAVPVPARSAVAFPMRPRLRLVFSRD